jgi:hypothetical protein
MATRYEINLANFAYNYGFTFEEATFVPGVVEKVAEIGNLKKEDLAKELSFDPTTELAEEIAATVRRAAAS